MKKQYILLKDSPELKMGAILEEECDGGDQEFKCITEESIKMADQQETIYSRDTVMKQKDWFLPFDQTILKRFIKFIRKHK